MSNELAAIKRNTLKKHIEQAYDAYKRKEPGSADNLFEAVRALAYVKVHHLEYDFKKFGSAETADDWAQDICVSVWSNLDKFVGTPSQFYSWVHKIAFNQATDAFTKLYEAQQIMTGLTVPARHNDSVDGDEEDNPELFREGGYDGGGIGIPKSVTGTDRNICLLIRDGRSYAEVAEELAGMTEEGVKQRVKRLKKRLQTERAA